MAKIFTTVVKRVVQAASGAVNYLFSQKVAYALNTYFSAVLSSLKPAYRIVQITYSYLGLYGASTANAAINTSNINWANPANAVGNKNGNTATLTAQALAAADATLTFAYAAVAGKSAFAITKVEIVVNAALNLGLLQAGSMVYSYNAGSGTTVIVDPADSSGNGRNLTQSGTITPITSPWSGFGGAAQFNASAPNNFTLPPAQADAFDPRGARARTYEIRIITPASPVAVGIMGQWSGNAFPGVADWLLGLDAQGRVAISFGNSAGTVDTLTGPVLPNATAAVLAFDSQQRLFVNGSLVLTGTGVISANPSATEFAINKGGNQTAQGFVAEEVRISNSLRNAGNYTPAAAPFATDANTLGLYHLDNKTVAGGGGYTQFFASTANFSHVDQAFDITSLIGGDYSKLGALGIKVLGTLASSAVSGNCAVDSVELRVTTTPITQAA